MPLREGFSCGVSHVNLNEYHRGNRYLSFWVKTYGRSVAVICWDTAMVIVG